MPITTPTIISWILIFFIIFVVIFFVILRIIRYFISFPIPSSATSLIDNPIRRRIQPPAKTIDRISIQPGMHVLEIGPGKGTLTIEASRRTGAHGKVFAIDIQSTVISRLHTRLHKKSVTNVIPLTASAYDLPFPDKTFDRIFMVAVLAEIPDKHKALKEINRVLKDDGLLAIGEFLPDPDYPRQKTVIRWCAHAEFRPMNTYGSIIHYVITFKKIGS